MENAEIINYIFKNLSMSESIIVYNDRVIYKKDNNGVMSNTYGNENEISYNVQIKDKRFIDSLILENIYIPRKEKIVYMYNKYGKDNNKEYFDNTHKEITINYNGFNAVIDMHIEEYGDLFINLIKDLKVAIFNQLKGN